MAQFKDLTIIFDDDAEPWAGSFVENYQAINVECYTCNIKTLLPIPNKEDREQLKYSKAILVILSEQLVDFLVQNKGLHLKDCISDPEVGVLFFLNVTEKDIREQCLEDRFTDFDSPAWTKRSYDESSSADDFQDCLNTIHEVVQQNSDRVPPKVVLEDNRFVQDEAQQPDCNPDFEITENSDSYMMMDKSKKTVTSEEQFPQMTYDDVIQQDGIDGADNYEIKIEPPKVRQFAEKQMKVEAVPDVVPCEMVTQIALCFKEPLEDFQPGSMDLVLVDTATHDEYDIKEVESLNPYTYKFKFHGNHSEKKMNIQVYWNDKCIGVCPLELTTYTHVIDGINNILLEVLDETCALLKKTDKDGPQKLDQLLKQKFLSDTTTIRPDAFENIFGMYGYLDHDVDSEEEIPTLVHLAAKYGLKEMGAKLMDLPSACKACSIANKDHKQPAEIAEQHENYELATFFRNITDLGEDMYAIYVKMQSYDSGYLKPKSSRYGNQSQFNDPGKALYYLYHGRDTVTRTQQDVPGQLVYDDADLKPTEDYMDMNKVARKLNPPPPRARGAGLPVARQKSPGAPGLSVARQKSPAPLPPPSNNTDGEIYDDADAESQNTRFTFSMTPAEKEAASLTSTAMSPEQLELVKIQKQVAEEELSIDEARDLYFEWKRVNEHRPNDFKTRNEQMQKVHKLLENKNKENKKIKPPVAGKPTVASKPAKREDKIKPKKLYSQPWKSSETKVYVRADAIQRPPPSPKPPQKAAVSDEVYDDVLDNDSDDKKPTIPSRNFRNSFESNGPQDMKHSTAGSSIGASPEVTKRTGPRKKPPTANLRKSFTDAPPLPPKLPARGVHLQRRYEKPQPEPPKSPVEEPSYIRKK